MNGACASIKKYQNKLKMKRFMLLVFASLLMLFSYNFEVTNAQSEGVITQPPLNTTVALGTNATFSCSGHGIILWQINLLQIQSKADQSRYADMFGIFAEINEQNMSQLVVFASALNNGTRIECLTLDFNPLGGPSPPAFITVYSFPHPPSNLDITRSGVDLSLSWEAPFSLEGENITYIVRVTNTRSRESRELESDSPQLVFSESIGERDCSLYEFRVYSVNPFGRSKDSINGSHIIPTKPMVIHSADVMWNISMENGTSVVLTFNVPTPCDVFPVDSMNVVLNQIQPQTETLRVSTIVTQSDDTLVHVLVDESNGLVRDSVYGVTIEAVNDVGSTLSEEVIIYTTGLQSSSVVLEVNDTASVTCNFALGSDALGCEVSFYVLTSMELLFAQNITREPSSGNTLTKNIPLMGSLNGSTVNITALTSEWLADGSVSLVEIEAEVEIIEPIMTTLDVSIVPTSDTSSTTRPSLGSPTNPGTLYIIVGVSLAIVVILLLLVITTVVLIVSLRLRKRKDAAVEIHDQVLEPNVAYGVLDKSKRQRNQPQNGINVTQGEPTVQEMIPNTAYGLVLVAEETIQGNETPPPIPPKSHNNVGVASYEDIDAAIGRSPAYEEIKNSLHTPAAALGGSPLYEEIKAKTKGPSLSVVYDDIVLK